MVLLRRPAPATTAGTNDLKPGVSLDERASVNQDVPTRGLSRQKPHAKAPEPTAGGLRHARRPTMRDVLVAAAVILIIVVALIVLHNHAII